MRGNVHTEHLSLRSQPGAETRRYWAFGFVDLPGRLENYTSDLSLTRQPEKLEWALKDTFMDQTCFRASGLVGRWVESS